MRLLGRVAMGLGVLLAAGGGWLAWSLADVPDLEPWRERWGGRWEARAAAAGEKQDRRVTLTWLGVTTLLVSDGATHLLTDGFFTRVSLWQALARRPVAPDAEAIADALERAGIGRLAAVMPVHSHYDHAMDAPEVARRTGALLVGSRTTAWVGRGAGLPEEQIRVATPGVPMRFGAFEVTFLESRHVPLPLGQGALGEELAAPLVPPAPVDAWVEGGSWTIRIAHPLGVLLVQGSAGFVPGALEGHPADAVALGVGALSRQDDAYREAYWHELVEVPGVRLVLPVHWDDLTAPPRPPLRPMPRLLDDLDATFGFLEAQAAEDPDVEVALLPAWEPVVLFAKGKDPS